MKTMDDALNSLPAALQALSVEPMLVIRLQIAGARNVGTTVATERRFVAVTGGTFTAPQGTGPAWMGRSGLSGTVAPGGNDIVTVRGDGTVLLDARIVLETAAGESVLMTYGGVRSGDAATMARLAAGDQVDPSEYYFRISAKFETSCEPLSWMNGVIAVGSGYRQADTVIYSVFRVL